MNTLPPVDKALSLESHIGPPLHQAAWEGDIAMVQNLLKQPNIDVNKKCESFATVQGDPISTPLGFAIAATDFVPDVSSYVKVIRALLLKGAICDERLLFMATKIYYPEDHCPKKHHTNIVKELLAGPDVDAISYIKKPDKSGNYLLHYAAINGAIKTIKLLLAKGADINAKNTAGETPLYCIIYSYAFNIQQTIKILLAEGADINAQTKDGKTLFPFIAGGCYEKTIKMMLAYGLDVAEERTKKPLLDRFIETDNNNFRVYLLAAGLNILPTHAAQIVDEDEHEIEKKKERIRFEKAQGSFIEEVKSLSKGRLADDSVPKMLRALTHIIDSYKETQPLQESLDRSTIAEAIDYLQVFHGKKPKYDTGTNIFLDGIFSRGRDKLPSEIFRLPTEIVKIIVGHLLQPEKIAKRCEITTEELYQYYGYVEENYQEFLRFSETRFTDKFLAKFFLTSDELDLFRPSTP